MAALIPEDLDFGFQVDPSRRFRTLLNDLDQIEHILGGGIALVDYKIPVHVGNGRPAYSRALETKLIDQFAGRNSRWILENAPGARGGGLGFPTLCTVAVHPAGNRFPVRVLAL